MLEYLIRRYIPNYPNTTDGNVRFQYAFLVGNIGVLINFTLFVCKAIIGFLSGSIAIVSDAFNNLTDCLSNVVTVFGYRLANKQADHEHPFGHGRLEYVVNLVVVIFIFIVAVQLLQSSITRFFAPSYPTFSIPLALVLGLTILAKLWMYVANKKVGTKIQHMGILASAYDARNDILATLIALLGMFMSSKSKLPIDAIAGVIISGFIFYSGWTLAREIISQLVGKTVSDETKQAIIAQICTHKEIKGVHDLMIHDYGPSRLFGSAHAELDNRLSLEEAHQIVDQAEREILQQFHVNMTLHVDPIDLKDTESMRYKAIIEKEAQKKNAEFSIHDFHTIHNEEGLLLQFDIAVPENCVLSNAEIKERIDTILKENKIDAKTDITFDHEYIAESLEDDETISE